jgi:glycosyltransferase involved in cell wall biosynthesis
MKILHLVHQYFPEKVGGTEVYTRSLARQQAAQGHSVAIFAPASTTDATLEPEIEDAVRVYRVGIESRGATAVFRSTFYHNRLNEAFTHIISQEQPDIVHIQHLMGLPTSLMTQVQAAAIPYVITLWDFWWVCANGQLLTNYSQELCQGPRSFINCARCALARAGLPQFTPAFAPLALPLAARNRRLQPVLAGAHRLIAPAAFVRDWYADHGAPADKLVVVPPGLNYPDMLPIRENGVGERPFRIGYIGGISWQKGVHLLLEAFLQLDNSELWIAGDTNFDPQYTARLHEVATTAVQFRGKLDRAAIWKMLCQLDVLVVPSIWYETFGFVISEAFVAGVPVIGFDLGVVAERIQHGCNGLLLPVGDVQALAQALCELQKNPDKLAQLQAGIQPVLTMAEHVEEITAVYVQITNKK